MYVIVCVPTGSGSKRFLLLLLLLGWYQVLGFLINPGAVLRFVVFVEPVLDIISPCHRPSILRAGGRVLPDPFDFPIRKTKVFLVL